MDNDIKPIITALINDFGFSDIQLENSVESILVIDIFGTVIKANSSFCSLFGLEMSSLVGTRPPYPFWPKDLYEEFEKGFKQTLRDGVKGRFESIHQDKTGHRFPVNIYLREIRDASNKNLGYLALYSKIESDLNKNIEVDYQLVLDDKGRNSFGRLYSGSLFGDLENTLDNISDGIIQLDNDWCFTYLNDRAGEILKKVPKDILGKNIWAEFPELQKHSFLKPCYTAAKTKKSQIFEDFFESLEKYLNCRVYPSLEGVTIFFSDTTEIVLSEINSAQNQEIFQILKDTLTQSLFILEVVENTYKFLTVSKSFLKTLGIHEEDVIEKYVEELIPEPSLSLVLSKYKQAIDTKKAVEWEETTPYETGLKTAIVTVSPMYNEMEICTHLVGIVHDITERKEAEELLAIKENFLNNILNNVGDPIFVKDINSRLLLVNDAFCSIFELNRADILGKTLAEDVSKKERESFLKIDKEVLTTGIENINEETLTVRGGETKIISTKKTRFIDEQKDIYLIGIIRDITERKKAEIDLKKAKEFTDSLVESMHEGLVVFNMNTEIIQVNPSFCKISGFLEEDLVGQQCPYPFSPPEIEDEAVARHGSIVKGEELNNFETIYMRKDGSRFNVSVMISSIKDSKNTTIAYFGTVIDTTERKKAELELKLAKEFTDKLVMSMQEGLIIVDL